VQEWTSFDGTTFIVLRHYLYSDPVTPTKERALDAAIELLGTRGLRALTHGRVDERAGIPKGSTSNYFRTRAALLSGVVEHIVRREMSGISPALAPATPEEFVDTVVGLFEHTTVHNRVLTTARLVLFMEAAHDEQLRLAVTRGREVMARGLAPALARLGAHHPEAGAQALMACLEGLILHRVARHDDSDPRPAIELVVRAAID
jgi:AcrR family transcriptional regulator